MTINTTNSQAASFRAELLPILRNMYLHFEPDAIDDEICSVLDMIDAKLAQARSEGVNAANDFRALVSDSDTAEIKEWKARAIAAESRLAEIQRGVEGLQRYGFDGTFGGDFGKHSLGCYVKVDAVLALLQPQGQAATTMMRTELPQGWKLVPVEPTEEMMDSCRCGFITALAMPAFVAAYKTMVEAAPSGLPG